MAGGGGGAGGAGAGAGAQLTGITIVIQNIVSSQEVYSRF